MVWPGAPGAARWCRDGAQQRTGSTRLHAHVHGNNLQDHAGRASPIALCLSPVASTARKPRGTGGAPSAVSGGPECQLANCRQLAAKADSDWPWRFSCAGRPAFSAALASSTSSRRRWWSRRPVKTPCGSSASTACPCWWPSRVSPFRAPLEIYTARLWLSARPCRRMGPGGRARRATEATRPPPNDAARSTRPGGAATSLTTRACAAARQGLRRKAHARKVLCVSS